MLWKENVAGPCGDLQKTFVRVNRVFKQSGCYVEVRHQRLNSSNSGGTSTEAVLFTCNKLVIKLLLLHRHLTGRLVLSECHRHVQLTPTEHLNWKANTCFICSTIHPSILVSHQLGLGEGGDTGTHPGQVTGPSQVAHWT